MPKKNQPGCGCCTIGEVDCVEDSDDFNRPDASGPGAEWTEVSGTWPIAGNQLTTSSTNAVATFQHVNSSGDDNFRASVRVKGAAGDRLRLIYRQDGSNYVAAELVIGQSDDGLLNLIANDGSGEDVIATRFVNTMPDTWYTLHLCVTDFDTDMVFAAHIDDESDLADVHDSSGWTDPEWGVGTGSQASAAAFDDMTVFKCNAQCPCCSEAGTGGDCEECCDDGDLPRYWLVSINGLSNDDCDHCTDLSSVVLERDPNKTACIWTWTLENDYQTEYSETWCESKSVPGCDYGLRLSMELVTPGGFGGDPTNCRLILRVITGRFAAAQCSLFIGCGDRYEVAFLPTGNCLSGAFTLTSQIGPCTDGVHPHDIFPPICGNWPSTVTVEALG